MNEIEMTELYHIIKPYTGEDFKRILEEKLEGFPEDIKEDFLLYAMKQNIEDSKENLNQSKIIRTMKDELQGHVIVN